MKTTLKIAAAVTLSVVAGGAINIVAPGPTRVTAAEPVAAEPVAQPYYGVDPVTTFINPVNGKTYKLIKACTTPAALAEWLDQGIRDRECRTFSTQPHDGYITLHLGDGLLNHQYYDLVQAEDGTADDTYYVLTGKL